MVPYCMSLVVLTLLLAGQTTPPRVALTADVLKAVKATSNNPAGDAFVDKPEKLNALIDAFTADSSFASPVSVIHTVSFTAR